MDARTAAVALATLCALAGCKRNSSSSAPSPGSTAPATAAPQAATAGSATAAPSDDDARCESLRKRFRDRLAAASNACESDGDCTCSPGGIEPAGCGRVVDRKTAKELYELYDTIRTDCGLDFQCGAQRCLARCVGGRCQRDAERIDGPTPTPELLP